MNKTFRASEASKAGKVFPATVNMYAGVGGPLQANCNKIIGSKFITDRQTDKFFDTISGVCGFFSFS